jgi:hypothetical protein
MARPTRSRWGGTSPTLAQRRVTQVEVRRKRAEQGGPRRPHGGKEAVRRPVSLLVRAPQALPRRERGPRPQEPLRPREVAGAREVGAVWRRSRALAHRPRLLARAPRRPRERLPGTERTVAPQAGRVLRAIVRLHHVSLHAMASEYMPELARRRPLDERCPRSVYFLGDVGGRFGDGAGSRGGMPWGRRIEQPESRERSSGGSCCLRSP